LKICEKSLRKGLTNKKIFAKIRLLFYGLTHKVAFVSKQQMGICADQTIN
jgi:hypothetical protein